MVPINVCYLILDRHTTSKLRVCRKILQRLLYTPSSGDIGKERRV